MLIAYLLFELVSKYLPTFINYGIVYGKYGKYFISELTWLIVILVIIYCSNNSKVLSEKKESFFKTLIIALPLFLYSVYINFANIKSLLSANLNDVIRIIK